MAISLHFVSETGAKTKFKSLREIVAAVSGTIHKSVCDGEKAVWLRDGVYLPWKSPTTKHKVHGWTDYRRVKSDAYKVVFHELPWSNVGRTSCWADTRDLGHVRVGLPQSIAPGLPLTTPTTSFRTSGAKRLRGSCLTHLLLESLASDRVKVILRARASRYTMSTQIGSGSFATVFRGLCHRDQTDVAIKKLKQKLADPKGIVVSQCAQEIYVLERCGGHPNIIQILDMFFYSDCAHIVFELHGRSLRDLARLRGFVPSELRVIALHLLAALGYLHAELGLVHTDVSEKNCLVDDVFVVKLADFGSCVSEIEEERPDLKAQVKNFEPLMLTTLPYRAPEVLLGCTGFGPSVDVWALGVMLLQFAGHTFTLRTQTTDAAGDARGAIQKNLDQLGTPDEEILAELQALPFWPSGAPSRERRAHIPAVLQALRPEGVSFVDSCLSWRAASRPTASQALGSPFLTGCLPLLGGSEPHKGQRHSWNAVGGTIFQDVLEWLREDPGFELLGHLLGEAKDARNTKMPTNVVRHDLPEGAFKLTVGGYLTPNALSQVMNKVAVEKALVLERFMQWRQAFLSVNAADVRTLQEELAVSLSGLKDLGPDGRIFLENDIRSWLCSVAEIHVILRRSRRPLAEEMHHDGAASVLHLGATFWGRRTVTFKQEEITATTTRHLSQLAGPDVVVPCWPGHVYLGGVTGARHQVQHPEYDDADMWTGSGFGPCSVAIMCRCAVWPNRGRNMFQTPGPKHVFDAVTTCCRNFLARSTLRAPTLAECQRETISAQTPVG